MALYDDPLQAAYRQFRSQRSGQSFFPSVNQRMFGERDDLLQNIDNTFYGGGQVQPTPTPTPTPLPRSYFGGGYLNRTGFQGNVPTMTPLRQFSFGLGMNRSQSPTQNPNTFDEWQKRYGFSV